MIRPAELIQRKRDGEELADAEIAELVLGYARGDVPDYQMAAFCMAVFFRGLSPRETFALTDAMIRSGETIDLSAALGRKVVDKHSTGGVGDKTSLAVAPIVAACGVPMGKMSGRGLGHTGGTLDKLESIPGFRTELSIDEFIEQVRDVGVAIVGQTADLVPADKLLYALRDVTATVDQRLADRRVDHVEEARRRRPGDRARREGRRRRVHEDARRRARARRDDARAGRAGRPRGRLPAHRHGPAARRSSRQRARGARGACDTVRGARASGLHGARARRVRALLALSDLGIDLAEGRGRAEAAVADGSADAVWGRWIEAQGGTSTSAALPEAPVVRDVSAPHGGYVSALGAIAVGNAALHLGAGRRTKDDEIDHAVGVVVPARSAATASRQGRRSRGARAQRGECRRGRRARCSLPTRSAAEPPAPRDVLLEVVD